MKDESMDVDRPSFVNVVFRGAIVALDAELAKIYQAILQICSRRLGYLITDLSLYSSNTIGARLELFKIGGFKAWFLSIDGHQYYRIDLGLEYATKSISLPRVGSSDSGLELFPPIVSLCTVAELEASLEGFVESGFKFESFKELMILLGSTSTNTVSGKDKSSTTDPSKLSFKDQVENITDKKVTDVVTNSGEKEDN